MSHELLPLALVRTSRCAFVQIGHEMFLLSFPHVITACSLCEATEPDIIILHDSPVGYGRLSAARCERGIRTAHLKARPFRQARYGIRRCVSRSQGELPRYCRKCFVTWIPRPRLELLTDCRVCTLFLVLRASSRSKRSYTELDDLKPVVFVNSH